MQMTLNLDERAKKVEQAKADVSILTYLMGRNQLRAIRDGLKGEEQQHFQDKIVEYSDRFRAMPKVYAQDGLGDQAVVYLHYFYGSMDWYITERDTTQQQLQAFGLADFGDGGELGYISIQEIIETGKVELDLYWTPKTLAEVKKSQEKAYPGHQPERFY